MHTQRAHERLEGFRLTLADTAYRRSLGLRPRFLPPLFKASSSHTVRPATLPRAGQYLLKEVRNWSQWQVWSCISHGLKILASVRNTFS